MKAQIALIHVIDELYPFHLIIPFSFFMPFSFEYIPQVSLKSY